MYSAAQSTHRINAIHKIIDRLIAVREGRENPLDADQDGMDDPFNSRPPRHDAPYAKTGPMNTDGDGEDSDGIPNVTSTLNQEWGDWTNRYMVHNPTIQLSNTSRDILLKYYYSQRERRGFMYHLSAKAIKFIRDLSKEHAKKRKERYQPHRGQSKGQGSQRTQTTQRSAEDTQKTERLLDGISGGLFFAPNESEQAQRHAFGDALDVDPETAADSLPDSFDLLSGHLCIFIKPQISLKSDIDDKSSITLTAFRAQLKSFQVVDTRVPDDPVNSQVLSQTFATLDGLQAFYPQAETEKRAGAAFVPLETLVDLSVEPWGFDRVVPRTSAALRYDKFNQLRMSSKNGIDSGFTSGGPQDSHFQTGTDRSVLLPCTQAVMATKPYPRFTTASRSSATSFPSRRTPTTSPPSTTSLRTCASTAIRSRSRATRSSRRSSSRRTLRTSRACRPRSRSSSSASASSSTSGSSTRSTSTSSTRRAA